MRRLAAVASTLLVGALAGCASGASSGGSREAADDASAGFGHVHGISADGPALLLATHVGLFRQVGDGRPVRISEQPFDVMGFTPADGRLLASGHPASGTDPPADLGLGQSTDSGRTWAPVSLLGKVDFHRLRSRGQQIWGISAGDGSLLTSTDGGRSWTSLGRPGLFDLAVDPADPSRVVGTTEAGPVISGDGGRSFGRLADAPLLGLLAWSGSGLFAITPTGEVMRSSDGRTGWTKVGTTSGTPEAFWADGTHLAIATSRAVSTSDDGGRSFTDRITLTPPTG